MSTAMATASTAPNFQKRVVEYERAPVCQSCTQTHLDFEDTIGAMLIAKLALRRIVKNAQHHHQPNSGGPQFCALCAAIEALEDMKP